MQQRLVGATTVWITGINRPSRPGGEPLREPKDEFYGDRSAGVKDDWGNTWWLATHIEDVSGEEMKRREKELREDDG